MTTRTILLTGLRILLVCVLLAVCFAVGSMLSGLDKIGQQTVASQPVPPGQQQVPEMPEGFLRSFLIFTLCAGGTLSYLILRSRWHGWMLAGVVFVSMYGISTVASQLDSVALLSNKLPPGMIRAIFVQGAIAAALFAPLAVLTLGKWRAASVRAPMSPAVPRKLASNLLRLAILIAAFVFLYMFFGYYVAWQNPELRRFYGGPELATFWVSLRYNWTSSPWIYTLAAFRALLYIACLYPLVRMLHTSRWESALAAALFLACWTTVLLLPNPLMPASVARSHFWETLGFSLVFGALAGWLLSFTAPAPRHSGRMVGFNASHSMGLILFGLVFGFLALAHGQLLFQSPFLLVVGLAMLGGFAVLAKVYFFSVPLKSAYATLLDRNPRLNGLSSQPSVLPNPFTQCPDGGADG